MVAITAQSSKSRLHFPFKESEQWWEIWHNTERSLAAQFAMIPVSAISNVILRVPGLMNVQSGNKKSELTGVLADSANSGLAAQLQKSFGYAIYEYLENSFLRTTAAQTIRSWTKLYSDDKQFQKCLHASDLLQGLTASAAFHDTEGMPLIEELKEGKTSSVHDLVFHSHDANQMLSDFVTGELELTPSRLKQFDQHIQALSDIAAQPLSVAQEMRQNSTQEVTAHTRPSDYIREVVTAKTLETPRQMQILFSLIPPLITHGALALSHVEYVPQEKRFLTVKQSVALAKEVQSLLDAQAYEYNHDKDGNLLIKNAPAGAIVKKTADGFTVLSEQELLQLSNKLLSATKQIAGANINRILSYADEHYEAIEQQLVQSVYPEKTTNESLKTNTALVPPSLQQSWHETDCEITPHSHITNRWKSYMGAAVKYQSRPEAQQEKTKLYRRKLPNDITKAPVNFVKEALKITNADPDLFFKAVTGKPFENRYEDLSKKTFGSDDKGNRTTNWNRLLLKEAWGIAMKPLAGSFGLVSIKETLSTNKKLTGDSITSITQHLSNVVATGKTLDATIQQTTKQVQSTIENRDFAIDETLQAEVKHIQKKAPKDFEAEDYATLQDYFSQLSNQINQQSDSLLSPYRKDEGETLQNIVARTALSPVSDLPSALMSLSFVQSVLAKEKRNIDSLEFVDPQKNLIPLKSFRIISDAMEKQLTAAGIAIVGQTYQDKLCQPQGFAKGQMVEFNSATKQYEPLKPETIIRLANVMSRIFTKAIGQNVQRIAQGTVDKTHYAAIEQALFASPKVKKEPENTPLLSGTDRWKTTKTMKPQRSFVEKVEAAWQHATRPEALHEAKLLWSRTTYNRVTGIPVSLWQNIRKAYVPFPKAGEELEVNMNPNFNDVLKKPGKYLSKGNLLSELWGAVAYPAGEFISTLAREMTRYKVADTIGESSKGSQMLSDLMTKASDLSIDWEAEYREHTGKSAALEDAAAQETYKMIPRIATKPAHLRTDSESQLMDHYMEQVGSIALASVSQLTTSNKVKDAKKSSSILTMPAENLVEAHETLAKVKEVMDASRQHLGVLRYVNPDKVLINAKGLAQLSETIEAQYLAAEKTGDLDTDQGFIRLSNVIRDECLIAIKPDKLKILLNENERSIV